MKKCVFVTLVCLLLTGCLSIRYPPAGTAVAPGGEEALVFGRFRVFCMGADVNPWGITPASVLFDVDMNISLVQLEKRRTAFNPKVESDGSFYWLLPTGTYVISYNPRDLSSPAYSHSESESLAAFQVLEGGAARYIGTLSLDMVFVLSGDTKYDTGSLEVVDEFDGQRPEFEGRFPGFSGEISKGLMVYDPDLPNVFAPDPYFMKDMERVLGRHGMRLMK